VGQKKIRENVDTSHSLGSYLYGKRLDGQLMLSCVLYEDS